MIRYAALAVCALAWTGALAGCDSDAGEGATPPPLGRAALEHRVARSFTPDDPGAKVAATCDGGLAVRAGATRDCHLVVGRDEADVHVRVASVDAGRPRLQITPYIPADRLGEALRTSLTGQGYRVEEVTCDDELVGEPGGTTECTASPSQGEGRVAVHVTKVDGLLVNFDYEVVR